MMYDEFIRLAGLAFQDMSVEEYAKTVEVVYMHHPAIKDAGGKKQIVEYYKAGLIADMLPRAKQIREKEAEIRNLHRQIEAIREGAEMRILSIKNDIKSIEDDINSQKALR